MHLLPRFLWFCPRWNLGNQPCPGTSADWYGWTFAHILCTIIKLYLTTCHMFSPVCCDRLSSHGQIARLSLAVQRLFHVYEFTVKNFPRTRFQCFFFFFWKTNQTFTRCLSSARMYSRLNCQPWTTCSCKTILKCIEKMHVCDRLNLQWTIYTRYV